jgi:hypothetical protein
MPHVDYTLPRETAAILARDPISAKSLATWYCSGNSGEALSALRRACSHILTNGSALQPDDREAAALTLADIEPLR